MKFWQGLVFAPTDELVTLARCAEDLGFTGAILSDHLVTYRQQLEHYPASEGGEVFWHDKSPWPDPWVSIATLAQATSQLKFTTAVYVLPLRDPFTVAKSLSTLAVLSGNRVALGAGIGWQQGEFALTGQTFTNRGRRTDEALDVIAKLTTGLPVEHRGEFYDFPELCMSPAPETPIPVYIGGESDAALCRASRHNGWIGMQYTNSELTDILTRLQSFRAQSTPCDEEFEVIVGTAEEPSTELFDQMEQMGVTGVMTSSWPTDTDRHTDLSLDEKIRHMEEFSSRFINQSHEN